MAEIQAAPEFDRARANPFARLLEEPLEEGIASYTPSDADLAAVSEVDRKYQEWLQVRRIHEPQWFTNSAFFRNNSDVRWSGIDGRMLNTASPIPQRSSRKINRIFAKVRARRAKFLKNRPTWIVVPATSDLKDKLDARTTGKVLDYIWRKIRLELKFRDALTWAEVCGRGYWWFGWDPDALGRVAQQMPGDPMNPAAPPQKVVSEAVVGEVTVEVGSTFEILVGNSGMSSLSYQNELIRARERDLDYIRTHFPDRGHLVQADGGGTDPFQYESQIAGLSPIASPFGGGTSSIKQQQRDAHGNPSTAVVKEYFCRPNSQYPKGRYVVVAGGVLLRDEQELPFGLWDLENPFPCVEFVDVPSAGQYWSTTVIEQLIDLQREYNGVRSMISTNLKLMGHPKVFVAAQHQIPEGAWSPDAGEIIVYQARPGIDKPFVWAPPNIVGDAWRLVELLKTEFDDVTQIYPASEGKTAGTESGFHANLLQEASDLVHGPDIRSHEIAIEEAAVKIRRIIKQRYDIPRLITVTSASYQPEVFEFSKEDVDDYADVVVQAGSALPMLKGARIQAALDLYAKGVLGDPADPEVRRRLLNVLDMGGMEDLYEYAQVDEQMINIENSEAEDGVPVAQPRFYEDHQKHWTGHINKLKSPAVMNWPSPARMGLLAHAILHAKYINHAAAYQMSIEAGLMGLIPPPMLMGMPPMGGADPAAGGDPMMAQAGMMGSGPPAQGSVPGAPPGPGPGGASPDTSFGEAPPVPSASGT